MTTKMFCDGCGQEMKREGPICHKIEVANHLLWPEKSYVTSDMRTPASGGAVAFDLCPRCYNAVAGAAFKKFCTLPKSGHSISMKKGGV